MEFLPFFRRFGLRHFAVVLTRVYDFQFLPLMRFLLRCILYKDIENPSLYISIDGDSRRANLHTWFGFCNQCVGMGMGFRHYYIVDSSRRALSPEELSSLFNYW
jgi:hypothetical protein